MYLLPSLFTAGNIGLGFYALLQSMQGSAAAAWRFDFAAKAIGIAMVADMLDGRIARMTNTTSDFGRELDSLADVITFGVAPGVLAWMWGFRFVSDWALSGDARTRLVNVGAMAAFLFLIAGAARLARFNIQLNPRPSNPGRPGRKYFVGMPIPAGAAVIAATVHFSKGEPILAWQLALIWCALLVADAYLMVSTWRFYSFKDIDLRNRHPFWAIIPLAGLIWLIWDFGQYVLFVLALAYMFSGVFLRLLWLLRRPRSPHPPAYTEAPQA
ncbi:MAG: phosphatidylcholine/phosphatidylserine synthase [Acidobacteria bacterium]|nr:phosphatidylcholine/phosphatidylserine synthase [Acidobacteriota bacterium]